MYAYQLENNPYPSSPTPTEKDARILGGKRHKEAKSAILECIKELSNKVGGRDSNDGDFRVITLIQDVGSGKTHLARSNILNQCNYSNMLDLARHILHCI